MWVEGSLESEVLSLKSEVFSPRWRCGREGENRRTGECRTEEGVLTEEQKNVKPKKAHFNIQHSSVHHSAVHSTEKGPLQHSAIFGSSFCGSFAVYPIEKREKLHRLSVLDPSVFTLHPDQLESGRIKACSG
jgi:hypothetical protein